MKAVLRGKFIAIQAYLQKIANFQINNLTLHLQDVGGTTTNKAQRRKEIIKIRADLNDIETKRTIQRVNISKNW